MAELNPAHAELNITPSSDDGVPVLSVSGELDMSNVERMRAAVASSGAARTGRLVFELSGLRFIDSAGIAVLLSAAAECAVRLRDPSPAVLRIVELTGLTDVLPVAS